MRVSSAAPRSAPAAPVAHRLTAAAVVICFLVALPGCRPDGAKHACWTRESLLEAPAPAAAREPASGDFRGRVALPDSSNPYIAMRFTDERCDTRIRHASGRVIAGTSLLSEPVPLTVQLGAGPWYLGQAADGAVLVVQVAGDKVVSVTHTVFDGDGVLVYGGCGAPGRTFVRECVMDR